MDYLEMMRQNMKMAGMTDDQIEATLAAQKAAMGQLQGADAAMAAQMGMMGALGGKDLAGIMNDDSYFEFAEKPSIDESYQWAVACGADLIHLRADVINDLSSGNDKEDCISILSEQWGINNKEEFTEMAESLKTGRHSKVYKKLAEGKVESDFEEEAENLKQAKKLFKKDKLIGETIPNMVIWDLGRLINISRFAFDAGIINRKTALAYIKEAALLVKKAYKSWKELSIGYQFGRAVWGGIDEYETLKEGMEQLLSEKDSPWVKLPFDTKLNFE
jgi:hypothetical protein